MSTWHGIGMADFARIQADIRRKSHKVRLLGKDYNPLPPPGSRKRKKKAPLSHSKYERGLTTVGEV